MLHRILKFAVGRIRAFKLPQGRKQAAVLVTKSRRNAFLQQALQLLLVDVVAGAAQRRSEPAVMRHIHADVRFGMRRHPHTAARLHTENAGQSVIVQHFRPRGIGQNHHFAHQRVDGRTAFAAHNHDFAVFVEVDAVIVFFRGGRVVQPVSFFLLLVGQLQQVQAFGVIRELRMVCAARAGFAVEKRFDVLDAQIGGNRHHFNPAHRFGQLPLRVHIKINAECGHGFAFVQAVCTNPVVRQHGDFSCGEIDRAPAFENQLLDAAVGFDGQRRRGNVDADTFHAVAQVLHR